MNSSRKTVFGLVAALLLSAGLAGCDDAGEKILGDAPAPAESDQVKSEDKAEDVAAEKAEEKAPPAGGDTAFLAKLAVAGPLGDRALGSEDAPVTIIEYASFTCGHCANFHNTVFPELKKKYIETGKVRLIFREFPLDPLSTGASMLARCAPEDAYYDVASLLFQQVRSWAYSDDPLTALANLTKQVGFTQESFDACLTNQEILDGLNWVKDRAASEFGVNSTPNFFINGQFIRGGFGVEDMAKLIDPHLAD